MIRPLLIALTVGLCGPAIAQDPCANYVPQPKPQNAGRDIAGQDMDTILDRGFMTFALYEDFPPYSWEDGSTPRGVDVEIAALIADYVGAEPRYRFVGAAENLDADLRNNVWKGGIVGGAVSNVMIRAAIPAIRTMRRQWKARSPSSAYR